MTLPLYMGGAFGYATAMALGTLLGMGFGFVLERSGFGRARILAAQFYGTDMRVFKVMFSAIVTTTVGLGILTSLGVVDASLLSIPETFVGPHIIGGLLLGAGFIISGYCPGTAVVATASGNMDGVTSLLGVMAGGLAFGVAWPAVEGFYTSGARGVLTLPDVLGMSWPVVAFGVVIVAIGGFFGAEKVETWLASREGREDPNTEHGVRNEVFGAFGLAAALGIVVGLVAPAAEAVAPAPTFGRMDPVPLATQIVEGGYELYVVDLRAPEECAQERIPGAMCLSAEDKDAAFIASLPATRTLVLYDQGEVSEAPASVARFSGRVVTLTGGYDAFRAQVLTAPIPPEAWSSEAIAAFNLRQAMHAYFTGASAAPAPVQVKPAAVQRAVKKGGGC